MRKAALTEIPRKWRRPGCSPRRTIVRYAWGIMLEDRGTALLVVGLYRQLPPLIRIARQCLAQPHWVAAHEAVPLL